MSRKIDIDNRKKIMKTITITEDTKIPRTDIILEAGDIIKIQERLSPNIMKFSREWADQLINDPASGKLPLFDRAYKLGKEIGSGFIDSSLFDLDDISRSNFYRGVLEGIKFTEE